MNQPIVTCFYEGKKCRLEGIGLHEESIYLHDVYADITDYYGRYTRVDLISCSDIKQEPDYKKTWA